MPNKTNQKSAKSDEKIAADKNHQDPNLSSKQFREMKKRLVEYEKRNFQAIVLVPCSGGEGWKEMSEHSALIYYYKVALPLKLTPRFEEDNDFYCKMYRYGRIRTNNPATIRKRLKELKLLKNEYWKDGRVTFILERKFTQKEINELWEREQRRREGLKNTVKIENVNPTFYRNLLAVALRLKSRIYKRTDRISQQTCGVGMLKKIYQVMREYFLLTSEDKEGAKIRWRKIIIILKEVEMDIQLFCETKVWPIEVCGSIGRELVAVRKLAEEALIRLEKEDENGNV